MNAYERDTVNYKEDHMLSIRGHARTRESSLRTPLFKCNAEFSSLFSFLITIVSSYFAFHYVFLKLYVLSSFFSSFYNN